MLLDGFGADGQCRLRESHVLIVGCGALGCVAADQLARAGVGKLTVIDRDTVELTNLQRQMLYTEADASAGKPKAIAARDRLAQVNSQIAIEAVVADFNYRNAQQMTVGVDVLVDGLDNFETRFLLNDLAVSQAIPYIYGGAVGTTGMAMSILPRPAPDSEVGSPWAPTHVTPCLRCLFASAPPPGTSPTCDTVGVLAAIVSMVSSYQVAETLKVLLGRFDLVNRDMLWIDLWANETRSLQSGNAGPMEECPCCAQRQFEHLAGDESSLTTVLCGSNAIQIMPPPGDNAVPLDDICQRLRGSATDVCVTPHLLTAEVRAGQRTYHLRLFKDGRAIIKGTSRIDEAKSLYARFVGA